MKQFILTTSYITLGQLLKHIGAIQTGGEAKFFLSETDVSVNDQIETRRGRKLYEGDKVHIPGFNPFHLIGSPQED